MTEPLEGRRTVSGRIEPSKQEWAALRRKPPLRLIVIISDGIAGHLHQSRGIAYWLRKKTGAEIFEIEIPQLEGAERVRAGIKAGSLATGGKRNAQSWITASGGDSLMREVGRKFAELNISESSNDALVLSAGSRAAHYNLALSHIWSCKCATVMTPSFVGTEPFDFAIVPEHDAPEPASNIYTTLGAPNFIIKEELEREAEKFLAQHPPEGSVKWSVLIGGDDANYKIDGDWIKKNIGRLVRMAENRDADLYITTSRRTSDEASRALKSIESVSSAVRHLTVAAETGENPVPAMLGFSDEVFCTDDSINMVSEAITGGYQVVLMRAGRRKGFKVPFHWLIACLADKGALPRSYIRGRPRFDAIFDHLSRHGALIEYSEWLRGRRPSGREGAENDGRGDWKDFNEAKSAAEWICGRWHRQH